VNLYGFIGGKVVTYLKGLKIKKGLANFARPFFIHWLGDEGSNLNSRSQSGTKAINKEQSKEDKDTEDIKKT
jgi:hypothetical protein